MIRVWVPVTVLGLWAVVAMVGTWLNLEPNQIELNRILEPPTGAAWLGYDELGRGLVDRLAAGARTSFLVALAVVSVSVLVGTGVGGVSGWMGGWVDHLLMRIVDIMLAFPGMLLAIALAGVLGPGIGNVVFALCAVGWVGYARLVRAQVLSFKRREHVRAAVALGAGDGRILIVHVLPLLAAPIIVEASFGVAASVIAEAGLSFLGLGVQPPDASWGSMIREGTRYMLVAPHLVIVPAIALSLVVIAVNLLGDALRDALDVRGSER